MSAKAERIKVQLKKAEARVRDLKKELKAEEDKEKLRDYDRMKRELEAVKEENERLRFHGNNQGSNYEAQDNNQDLINMDPRTVDNIDLGE